MKKPNPFEKGGKAPPFGKAPPGPASKPAPKKGR